MSERGDRIAHAIESFVENPVTNLVKGIALLVVLSVQERFAMCNQQALDRPAEPRYPARQAAGDRSKHR